MNTPTADNWYAPTAYDSRKKKDLAHPTRQHGEDPRSAPFVPIPCLSSASGKPTGNRKS